MSPVCKAIFCRIGFFIGILYGEKKGKKTHKFRFTMKYLSQQESVLVGRNHRLGETDGIVGDAETKNRDKK
jgi:hypothetical protein